MTIDLGGELKAARQQGGQPLQVVADAAKLSTAYLHKLEAGVVNSPNPRLLMRLAEVLPISYATLMEAAGYVLPADPEPAMESASTAAVPPVPERATAAGNRDIVRLLQDVLTRLDALSRQHDTLLHLLSEKGPHEPPVAP